MRMRLGGKETALIVMALAAIAFVLVQGSRPIADETIHIRKIKTILDDRPSEVLPMFPGYHHVMAGLARALGIRGLDSLRAVTVFFGLASAFVFFLSARKLHPASASSRTLTYFLLPPLFPLFFLVYTDPLSMLLMLLMILAYVHQRFLLAGLAGSASLLIRQSNITWMALAFAMIYVDQHGWRWSWTAVGQQLRRGWTFLLGFGGFATFIMLNRGLVLGSSPAARQEILTGHVPLHAGSLFFSLVQVFLLLLPLHLWSRRRLLRIPLPRWTVLAGVALLFLLYLLTCRVTHPWNIGEPWYLHNYILDQFRGDILRRVLMFLPIALTVLWLGVVRFHRSSMYLLIPCWIASALPLWLIVPRYLIPPVVLLLLFLRPQAPKAEWATVIYLLAMNAALYGGIITGRFFI